LQGEIQTLKTHIEKLEKEVKYSKDKNMAQSIQTEADKIIRVRQNSSDTIYSNLTLGNMKRSSKQIHENEHSNYSNAKPLTAQKTSQLGTQMPEKLSPNKSNTQPNLSALMSPQIPQVPNVK